MFSSPDQVPNIIVFFPPSGHKNGTCVLKEEAPALVALHKSLLALLERHEERLTCSNDEEDRRRLSIVGNQTLGLEHVAKELLGNRRKAEDEQLFATLLKLIREIPNLGIRLHGKDGEVLTGPEEDPVVSLSLSHGPSGVSWTCWAADRLDRAATVAVWMGRNAVVVLVLALLAYGTMRLWRWYWERVQRLRQDTFELVEQALGLVAAQHHHYGQNPKVV